MSLRIETDRLILRPFTESDAAAACHNSRQPIVAHNMSDMVHDTEEDALGWIRYVNTNLSDISKPSMVFAIQLKANGTVIGRIYINRKKQWGNIVEIGFSVVDEHQNCGYATEAGKAIVKWTFEEAGQDELSAFVKPENIASRRVIEKLGFIYIDTRTEHYDGSECVFDFYRICKPT